MQRSETAVQGTGEHEALRRDPRPPQRSPPRGDALPQLGAPSVG